MPNTPQKTQCLVVPLDLTKKPYKAHLSRTDPTQNSLVYDLELLKSKQKSFSTYPLLSWQKLLISHIKTVPKFALKQMGKFGSGVFVEQKLFKNEIVIYPGQLIDAKSHPPLDNDERIYFLSIPNEDDLHVDAKYTDCIAKYFQHLPRLESQQLVNLDGEIPACENLGYECGYVDIKLDDETYIVPVNIFGGRGDIEPGLIPGFDYGEKYWASLNKQFTYFTPTGVPIPCYYLKVNNSLYQLSQSGFNTLLNDGFLIEDHRLLLLPVEVRETLANLPVLNEPGTVTLQISAIGEFEAKVKR